MPEPPRWRRFGAQVAYLRVAGPNSPMSQRELAQRVGVTQDRVYIWEKGRELPRLELFRTLYVVLGVSPKVLLDLVPVTMEERREWTERRKEPHVRKPE